MHCKQQIEKWIASFSLHAVKFWFVPWLTLLLSSLLVRCSSSHTSRNTDLLPIRICSSSCALGSQHRVGSQEARSHKRAYSDLRGEKKQGERRPTRISVSRPLGFLPNQRLMRLNLGQGEFRGNKDQVASKPKLHLLVPDCEKWSLRASKLSAK